MELEIHFLAEEIRFRIRAQVRWKRAAGRRSAPPGIGLTFLASEEAARKQLLAFVDGDDVHHRERHARRLPVRVEARVEIDGIVETCETDDISDGGCFLLVRKHPAIGTRLDLKLKGNGAIFSWVSVDAIVCWHRRGGDREGFGVRFLLAGERDRHRIEKLVGVVRERVAREIRMHPPRTAPPTSTPPTSTKPTSTSMLPRK